MDADLAGFDASSIVQELQCPICLEPLRETMLVQACLHRFCSECIQKCLRTSKLECPTCRLHIPSKRSLRRDTHTDAIVNIFCPEASRASSSMIRNDIWDWRRLHEQRTASFLGKAKSGSSDATDIKDISAIPHDIREDGIADETMNVEEGNTPLAKRQKSVNGADASFPSGDPEICVLLRYIPDYDKYNNLQNESNKPLERSCCERLAELRNKYTLDFPFVRVPSRTRVIDIRAYIAKMLASSRTPIDSSKLSFRLLKENNKVAYINVILSYLFNMSSEYALLDCQCYSFR